MSKEIETNVENILSNNGIKYNVYLVAKGVIRNNDWICDQWAVMINGETFDYFTGMGHRKKGFHVTPHITEPVYSLLLDASAINESFDNWCCNYGYDSDSITAFEIYRKCCDTAKKLNEAIKPSIQAQLHVALEGY